MRDTSEVGDGLENDDFFRNTEARQYQIAPEPVIRADRTPNETQVPLLLHMHTEALNTWRQLIDVRFKLLALVPGVSVLALTQLLDFNPSLSGGGRWARVAIATTGLLIVVALAIYDQRNSELHDDLISRVRRAEAELGVHTGIALGRRKSHGIIQHDKAIALVYGTTAIVWLASAVALLVHAVT